MARRGGHVSRPRIAAEAVDGYVQTLREANQKLETNGKPPVWQPKSSTVTAGEGRKLNPAIGNPPGEFTQIELTAIERELEEVLYANDEWIHHVKAGAVNWAKTDSLTVEQRQVQDWRGSCALPVHGDLETHVLNDLPTQGEPYEMATVEKTLKNLAEYGCDREKTLAGQALMEFKEVRAGKQQVDGVIWGNRNNWGGFVGQDMQVGKLHFTAIDFGENILLDAHAQRDIGSIERRERKTNA